MDGDEPVGPDLVEGQQRLDRAAELVHVAARPDQRRPRPGLPGRTAEPALDARRRGRPCARVNGAPSRRPARRRRGSRRCAGARRTSDRGCPARRRARGRRRSRRVRTGRLASTPPRRRPRRAGSSPSAAASPSAARLGSRAPRSARRRRLLALDAGLGLGLLQLGLEGLLAICCSVTLTMRVSGSTSRVEPSGRVEVGRPGSGCRPRALDGDLDVLGDVGGLGLDLDGRRSR